MKMKPLDEQVLVITGASSGNGLATARAAVRKGASVVLAARNLEALRQVEAELQAEGRRVAIVPTDVADQPAVERLAQVAIVRFGGFDTWINNAAAATYGTIEQVPVADHRRAFDVNYSGTLHGCIVAARHLRERGGGVIINLGSILGDRAIIQQGPYSATKHALQALTDTLRMELERDQTGISVTLIKPGAINTPYPEHARNFEDQPPRLPPPLYDPALVADAVLFACTTPRRELYVGGGGIVSSLVGQVAPRLTDLAMEVIGTRTQQKPGDPGEADRRDNLYEPRGDGQTHGSQRVHTRKTSLSLEAQKPPYLAGGAVAPGLGALLGLSRVMLPRR